MSGGLGVENWSPAIALRDGASARDLQTTRDEEKALQKFLKTLTEEQRAMWEDLPPIEKAKPADASHASAQNTSTSKTSYNDTKSTMKHTVFTPEKRVVVDTPVPPPPPVPPTPAQNQTPAQAHTPHENQNPPLPTATPTSIHNREPNLSTAPLTPPRNQTPPRNANDLSPSNPFATPNKVHEPESNRNPPSGSPMIFTLGPDVPASNKRRPSSSRARTRGSPRNRASKSPSPSAGSGEGSQRFWQPAPSKGEDNLSNLSPTPIFAGRETLPRGVPFQAWEEAAPSAKPSDAVPPRAEPFHAVVGMDTSSEQVPKDQLNMPFSTGNSASEDKFVAGQFSSGVVVDGSSARRRSKEKSVRSQRKHASKGLSSRIEAQMEDIFPPPPAESHNAPHFTFGAGVSSDRGREMQKPQNAHNFQTSDTSPPEFTVGTNVSGGRSSARRKSKGKGSKNSPQGKSVRPLFENSLSGSAPFQFEAMSKQLPSCSDTVKQDQRASVFHPFSAEQNLSRTTKPPNIDPKVAADDAAVQRARTAAAEIQFERTTVMSHGSWQNADDLKARGNQQYEKKQWNEALQYYRQALACLRGHPARNQAAGSMSRNLVGERAASYHSNCAAALMQLGRLGEALRACSDALHQHPASTKAVLRSAHVHLMLGEYAIARRFYSRAAALGAAVEAANGERMCTESEAELKATERELTSCRRRGSALSDAHKKVLRSLEASTRRTPYNACLRAQRAQALAVNQRVGEAKAMCEAQLVKRDDVGPSHGAIWSDALGRIFYDNCELEECIVRLAEAMERPGTPSGTKELLRRARNLEAERTAGNAAFKRGAYQAAIAAYTRAVQIDDTHGRFLSLLYCNRAAAYSKLNQAEKSVTDCTMAIQLDPNYAKAYLRRAEMRLKLGKRPLALDDFGKAQSCDPDGPVGIEALRRMRDVRQANASARAGAGSNYYNQSNGFRHGYRGNENRYVPPRPAEPKTRCHYDVLGIDKKASADDVRRAYKKLALKNHPDKNNESERSREEAQKRFVEVQKAYDVLSNESERHRYDATNVPHKYSNTRGYGGFGSFDDDLFHAYRYAAHGRKR